MSSFRDPITRPSALAAAAIIAIAAAARATAAVPLTTFLNESASRFGQSATSQQYSRAIESAERSYAARSRESPFRLRSEAARAYYQADPGLVETDLRTLNSWNLKNELLYQPRNSFEAALTANYSSSRFQEPTVYPASASPYTLSLTVSYDLIRGGSSGLRESEERAAALEYSRTGAQREGDLLAERVRFLQSMTDLFMNECKIARVREAQTQVAETVKAARIQARTRTLSHKDLLNFVDLENTFARRMAEQEFNRSQLVERARGWGADALEAAQKLKTAGPDCEPPVQDLIARSTPLIDDKETRKLVEALPTFQEANFSREASLARMRVARFANRVSLKPFISGELDRTEVSSRGLAAGSAGLLFEYRIPGPRGDYELAAAESDLASSTHAVRRSALEGQARVLELQASLASQRNILAVLEKSLQNSNELIRTLQIQRSIGSVDSLNYATAFVNQLDAASALLDSWAGMEKSMVELKELQARANARKAE
jgi:hypothetical protein